jgi:hypothetical protein
MACRVFAYIHICILASMGGRLVSQFEQEQKSKVVFTYFSHLSAQFLLQASLSLSTVLNLVEGGHVSGFFYSTYA